MSSSRPSTAEKRQAFRQLHDGDCFVIPNPWNIGSARYLQGLGYKALASTSSGFAQTLGLPDGQVPLEQLLEHLRELATETDIPVSADFEGGYADDPESVAKNVLRCIETGVAGLSIEDFTGDPSKPLYDFDLALARVHAARAAIDAVRADIVFTARTEGFIRGCPDLDETIRRLMAFADAGADCLYSPGITTREQVEAIVKAVAPKPVNLLVSGSPGHTVADLAEMGVRRISVGGTLARVAMGAFVNSACAIARDGVFDTLADTTSNEELNKFFGGDLNSRRE